MSATAFNPLDTNLLGQFFLAQNVHVSRDDVRGCYQYSVERDDVCMRFELTDLFVHEMGGKMIWHYMDNLKREFWRNKGPRTVHVEYDEEEMELWEP